jgi:hypothetical protein
MAKPKNSRAQLAAAAANLQKSGNAGSRAHDDEGNPIEDDDDAEKSLPSEDDLMKAMDVLVETATGIENGSSVRQQDLAARLASGEELTKSERDEMARHLSADPDLDDDLGKSMRENFADDPAILEGWDMSGYLDAKDAVLAKSLDGIRDALRSSTVENSAIVGRLAKGLHAVGMSNLALRREVTDLTELFKSLTGQANAQPAAAKGATQPSRIGQQFGEAGAAGAGQPLAKSLVTPAGGIPPPNDREGQKRYLNDALTELVKSTEPGGVNAAGGFGNINGVDLVFEQAKLENANEVSPAAMQLIAQHRNIAPAALS